MSNRLATEEEILNLAERMVEGMIVETKEELMAERADIVKVIRCKDCKYWQPHTQCGFDEDNDEYHNYCGYHMPEDKWYAGYWEADDYCSYGERKDNE